MDIKNINIHTFMKNRLNTDMLSSTYSCTVKRVMWIECSESFHLLSHWPFQKMMTNYQTLCKHLVHDTHWNWKHGTIKFTSRSYVSWKFPSQLHYIAASLSSEASQSIFIILWIFSGSSFSSTKTKFTLFITHPETGSSNKGSYGWKLWIRHSFTNRSMPNIAVIAFFNNFVEFSGGSRRFLAIQFKF